MERTKIRKDEKYDLTVHSNKSLDLIFVDMLPEQKGRSALYIHIEAINIIK